MLGARTPSSAERASTRSDSSKEISLQPNSRYTLSADEGVRAPSNRRLISNFDDFLGKAALAEKLRTCIQDIRPKKKKICGIRNLKKNARPSFLLIQVNSPHSKG